MVERVEMVRTVQSIYLVHYSDENKLEAFEGIGASKLGLWSGFVFVFPLPSRSVAFSVSPFMAIYVFFPDFPGFPFPAGG